MNKFEDFPKGEEKEEKKPEEKKEEIEGEKEKVKKTGEKYSHTQNFFEEFKNQFNKQIEEYSKKGDEEMKQAYIERRKEVNKILSALEAGDPMPASEKINSMKVQSEKILENESLNKKVKERQVENIKELNNYLEELKGKIKTESEKLEEKEIPEEEKEKTPEEKKIEGYSKFEDFGISNEDLEKIEGFNELSEGRQALVLENLKQLTLGRIQEEARGKYEEEKSESKFWGKLWKGITKEYQIAKKEKITKEEIMRGGLGTHEGVLSDLVGRAADGPEVEKKENGELEIKYAPHFENLTEEEKKKVEEFNKIASDFSKIPEEWRFKTASRKEREKYAEMEGNYFEARSRLAYIVHEKGAPIDQIFKTESLIHENQFLNTHPEAEKELKKMSTTKAIRRAISTTAAERGGYMAAGYVGRTALVGIMGFIGAPAAAAFLGGYNAGRREKKSLKEQDIEARKGKEGKEKMVKEKQAEEITKKMEPIRQSIEELRSKKEKFVKTEEGKWEKKIIGELTKEEEQELEKLENQFKELKEERTKILKKETAKDVVKAENLVEKLEDLQSRIMEIENKEKTNPEDEKKKDELLGMLNRRVAFTNVKIGNGLVNFGDRKERLSKHYQLLRAVSLAGVYSQGEIRKDIEERVDQFLEHREEKTSKARKKKIRNAILRGALIGAGFAAAGVLARHAQEFFGEGTSVAEEALKQGDIPTEELEIVPKVPPEIPETEVEPPVAPTEPETPVADTVKVESPVETQIPSEEAPTAEVFPSVEYQGGTSVWGEIENQIEARTAFKEILPKDLDKAEHTHLVDYIKDKVAANPEEYNLPKDIDIDTPTKEQLENLDWDKLFSESSGAEELDKALPDLTEAEKVNIIENNRILKELVKKTGEPIDSESVDQTLIEVKENFGGDVDKYIETGKGGEVPIQSEVEEVSETPEEIGKGELERKLSTEGAEGMTKDERNILQQMRNYKSEFVGAAGEDTKEKSADYLLKEAWGNPEYLEKYSEFGSIVREIEPNIEEQISSIDALNNALKKGFLGLNRAGAEEIKSATENAAQSFGLSKEQTEPFVYYLTTGKETSKEAFRDIMEGDSVNWMKFKEKIDSFRGSNI